jgi:hypothetical protein
VTSKMKMQADSFPAAGPFSAWQTASFLL